MRDQSKITQPQKHMLSDKEIQISSTKLLVLLDIHQCPNTSNKPSGGFQYIRPYHKFIKLKTFLQS